jgi:histidinol dehydrogenase
LIPVYQWPSAEAQERIRGKAYDDEEIRATVEKIVRDVRVNGDEALLRYTQALDGCVLTAPKLRVSEAELEEALRQVKPDLLTYLRQAKENIAAFHSRQKQQSWFTQDETGSVTGQLYRPLRRVGIYVPGGTASYPSTVLMTALPAKVAGVREIVMVTPPGKDGTIPAATLAAARVAGVTEIYRIGGAQAVAALAYGTATIPAVDKIVGPGNIFVALAKKAVFGVVGIDMLAGPSEILIIGDGSAKPEYAAADLLSQAEHDRRARAFLLTPDAAWAEEVQKCLQEQLAALPRQEIAAAALKDCGAVIITADLAEAFAVANAVAPEHLELLLCDPWPALALVENAGAVFLGPYSPEPLGDYWAGPSHVLPTGGTARYASPLTVEDFLKRSSIIGFSAAGMRQAAEPVRYLAVEEGLAAHGQALRVRTKEEKGK